MRDLASEDLTVPDSPSIRKSVDFIVLSAMRSGSNNLQDTLSEHPEIECGGEVFDPEHLQIWSKVYQKNQRARWAQRVGLKAAMAVARYGKRRFPDVMLRIARRPGRRMFGFRLFGNHVEFFGLNPLLEKLHTQGTKFIHLVRRDTFDQALSLVRAQATGVWKIAAKTPAAATAPLDLLSLAARIQPAAEMLHGHKVIIAEIARRYGALLLDFDGYIRDEQSYDRIQDFLGVRSRVALRHSNVQTPPIDAGLYRRLREELEHSGSPMRFNPEAM